MAEDGDSPRENTGGGHRRGVILFTLASIASANQATIDAPLAAMAT